MSNRSFSFCPSQTCNYISIKGFLITGQVMHLRNTPKWISINILVDTTENHLTYLNIYTQYSTILRKKKSHTRLWRKYSPLSPTYMLEIFFDNNLKVWYLYRKIKKFNSQIVIRDKDKFYFYCPVPWSTCSIQHGRAFRLKYFLPKQNIDKIENNTRWILDNQLI